MNIVNLHNFFMANFICEVLRFGQNFLDGEKSKLCFTASCLEVSHTCVHLLASLVFLTTPRA